MFKTFALTILTLGSLMQAASGSPLDGTAGTQDVVPARGTVGYEVFLSGGETTHIAVVGDGDTDLDLYIYGTNGKLVAYDSDLGDECVSVVFPRWMGRFFFQVDNLGPVYNEFELLAW